MKSRISTQASLLTILYSGRNDKTHVRFSTCCGSYENKASEISLLLLGSINVTNPTHDIHATALGYSVVANTFAVVLLPK